MVSSGESSCGLGSVKIPKQRPLPRAAPTVATAAHPRLAVSKAAIRISPGKGLRGCLGPVGGLALSNRR